MKTNKREFSLIPNPQSLIPKHLCLLLTLAFLFSCSQDSATSNASGNEEQNYACIISAESCLLVSVSTCLTLGGTVSDYCPGENGGTPSSSSSGLTQSSSGSGNPSGGNDLRNSESQDYAYFDGGVFIDPRDNKKYKYEKDQEGLIWMIENLNYSGANTLGWCYGSGTELGTAGADLPGCDNGYGRHYTYEIAMDNNEPQGLCPKGWRIPNASEWGNITSSNISSSFYENFKAGNYNTNPTWTLGWNDRGVLGFYWVSGTTSAYNYNNTTSDDGSVNSDGGSTNGFIDYFSLRCVTDDDCGSYNSATQFCYGKVYDKCNGEEYDPTKEACVNGALQPVCGSSYYNPKTHYCYNNQIIESPCELDYEYTSGTFYDLAVGICIRINTESSCNSLNIRNYTSGTWTGTIYCNDDGSSKVIECKSTDCGLNACASGKSGAYLLITESTGSNPSFTVSCLY